MKRITIMVMEMTTTMNDDNDSDNDTNDGNIFCANLCSSQGLSAKESLAAGELRGPRSQFRSSLSHCGLDTDWLIETPLFTYSWYQHRR